MFKRARRKTWLPGLRGNVVQDLDRFSLCAWRDYLSSTKSLDLPSDRYRLSIGMIFPDIAMNQIGPLKPDNNVQTMNYWHRQTFLPISSATQQRCRMLLWPLHNLLVPVYECIIPMQVHYYLRGYFTGPFIVSNALQSHVFKVNDRFKLLSCENSINA